MHTRKLTRTRFSEKKNKNKKQSKKKKHTNVARESDAISYRAMLGYRSKHVVWKTSEESVIQKVEG